MENKMKLYILMRSDLPSMNAGKAMAQASHASLAAIDEYKSMIQANPHNEKLVDIAQWMNETPQGFGTTIVLDVGNEENMWKVIKQAQNNNHLANVVIDPTYPYIVNNELVKLIKDEYKVDIIPLLDEKNTLLTRKEYTCGFVFYNNEKYSGECSLLEKLNLYR